MTKNLRPTFPESLTLCEGIGHRHPDDEHESRLDHVPGRHPDEAKLADPLGMRLVKPEPVEKRGIRVGGETGEAQSIESEQQHDRSAIDIEREKPGRSLGIGSHVRIEEPAS